MSNAEAVSTVVPEATPVVPVVEETVSGSTAAPDKVDAVQKPERTFTQAELDDILEKRLAKERKKRDESKREAELYKRLALERGEQPRNTPQQPVEPTRPKLEDFQDYDQYVEALSEWKADQKYSQRESARRQEEMRQRAAHEFQKLQSTYAERQNKVSQKYEDYEDVALNPAVPINQTMANAILMSEQGPDIAYYLGKNLEEAHRIANLPPLLAVKELGKIEAKLTLESAEPTPTKQASNAPAPIAPVGGRSAPPKDGPSDKDDIQTWVRKREAELRRKKRGD